MEHSQVAMLACTAVLFLVLLHSLWSLWRHSHSNRLNRWPESPCPMLHQTHPATSYLHARKFSTHQHHAPPAAEPLPGTLPAHRPSMAPGIVSAASFLAPLTQHGGPAQAADGVGALTESIPQITPLGAIL